MKECSQDHDIGMSKSDKIMHAWATLKDCFEARRLHKSKPYPELLSTSRPSSCVQA